MKFSIFAEIISLLKKHHETTDIIYKQGLDLTYLNDDLHKVISYAIGSIYGKEGLEIFDWWCYEKEWGERKDINMWEGNDENNTICNTIEELYQFLEENKNDDYSLPRKMTPEERLEVIKQMFS